MSYLQGIELFGAIPTKNTSQREYMGGGAAGTTPAKAGPSDYYILYEALRQKILFLVNLTFFALSLFFSRHTLSTLLESRKERILPPEPLMVNLPLFVTVEFTDPILKPFE